MTQLRPDSHDRDLARLFGAAAEEERASAPPFAATWGAALERSRPRPQPRLGWLPAGLAAGLLALVFLLAPDRTAEPPPSALAELTSWKAPTDVLLDTPGLSLWSDLPRISSRAGWGLAAETEDNDRGDRPRRRHTL